MSSHQSPLCTPRASWATMLLLVLMAGCAPTLPRPYLEAQAAAKRAYSAGRYEEAATHYRRASTEAATTRDRDEMLYREAASYHRGDQHRQARARYEQLIRLAPKGARTPRAAYQLIEIEIEHGNEAKGYRSLADFVLRYPESGLAKRGMLRYAAYLDRTSGEGAALGYLRSGLAWFHKYDLGDNALYQIADRLERQGQLQSARDTFLQCARKYPYPGGGLYDDSLFRASVLSEKLGQPKLAIEHLREMLSVREPSTFSGSYERPRFSAAQMRIATLYRDALHDHPAARREFRKLYVEFTTSLLRDDALWAEARLAAKDGDRSGACDAAELLVDNLPQSRFAPCATLLCPSAPRVDGARACRRYIRKDLERGDLDGPR